VTELTLPPPESAGQTKLDKRAPDFAVHRVPQAADTSEGSATRGQVGQELAGIGIGYRRDNHLIGLSSEKYNATMLPGGSNFS